MSAKAETTNVIETNSGTDSASKRRTRRPRTSTSTPKVSTVASQKITVSMPEIVSKFEKLNEINMLNLQGTQALVSVLVSIHDSDNGRKLIGAATRFFDAQASLLEWKLRLIEANPNVKGKSTPKFILKTETRI